MRWCEFNHLKCDTDHPLDIALFILQLISFGLSLTISIFSSHITFDGEISRSISEDLIENFNTGYYTSFAKISSSENIYTSKILEETNDNKVIFGIWEGTKKGCGKDNKAKVLKEGGNCDKNEEFLNDIPKQYITKYKGISLVGISKNSYYDLLYDGSIIKKNEECPAGKINVGYIDTLNNKLCLDNDAIRPISYVSISSIAPTGISNINTITGTDINFYYSSDPYPNSNEIPKIVNSFKIADSEVMCTLPNLYSFNYNFHPLDAYKKDYADKCVLLYDYNQDYTKDSKIYHSLDTIEMYTLFQENGIIDRISNSKIKDYGFDVEVYKNRNLKIYVRMHYGFDKDCLDKRETKLDIDTLGLIYGRADNILTWGNLILFIISTLVFSITDCATITKSTIPEYLVKYSFIIAPSFSLMIYTFYAKRYDDPFEDEMTCSDSITNDNYNIMISRIKSGGNKIVITSILLLILVVVNIVSFIIRSIKECKKN